MKRWAWFAAVAASLTLSTMPAGAQSPASLKAALSAMLGTIRAQFQPVLTAGSLTGCSIVFDALHTDTAYRQGQFIKVSGNFALVSTANGLGAVVKVVLVDIDPMSMEQIAASPGPSRAYLVGDDYSTNLASLVAASPSDTPGALFSIFQAEPSFDLIMQALDKRTATIAFNRGSGATDIFLPIDLDVAAISDDGSRQRSGEASERFLACAGVLIQRLEEQAKAQQ